jgi:hypothetical protein
MIFENAAGRDKPHGGLILFTLNFSGGSAGEPVLRFWDATRNLFFSSYILFNCST